MSLKLRPTVPLVQVLVLALISLRAWAWDPPALPTSDVARLQGKWLAAQTRNAARLTAPPLDKPEFILDDVLLRQHRKFAEYSGDSELSAK